MIRKYRELPVSLPVAAALASVTLRRGDLRDAITILKTIGFARQGQASCAETRR